MELINLYHKWMESGEIEDHRFSHGYGGLCNAIPKKYLRSLDLFIPDKYQDYWASELREYNEGHEACYSFNKLRQTIVLFICAMYNEL